MTSSVFCFAGGAEHPAGVQFHCSTAVTGEGGQVGSGSGKEHGQDAGPVREPGQKNGTHRQPGTSKVSFCQPF